MLPDGPPIIGTSAARRLAQPRPWIEWLGAGVRIGARLADALVATARRSTPKAWASSAALRSRDATHRLDCAQPGRMTAAATRARRADARWPALAPHTLMRRAGVAVARLALAVAPHARRVLVAAGPGNNGGDGLEAALHLHRAGHDGQRHAAGDATRLPAMRAMRWRERTLPACRSRRRWTAETAARLAIDALLGHRRRACAARSACAGDRGVQRAAMRRVLAVDLPSGLHADTGHALGDSVRARDAHA